MSGRSLLTIGLILVLLGIQFRAVDTYVLNQRASDYIEKRMKQNNAIRDENSYNSMLLMVGPTPRKELTHPRWLGLALISIGVVFLLQGVSRKEE